MQKMQTPQETQINAPCATPASQQNDPRALQETARDAVKETLQETVRDAGQEAAQTNTKKQTRKARKKPAQDGRLKMRFDRFVEIYLDDMGARLKETTMLTKRYILDLKILPYFGEMGMHEITAADVRKWQSDLLRENYSATYLKTINNQLAAIFNYAERFYDLAGNPCKKAGSIGRGKAAEMDFWTKDEYLQFLEGVKDNPMSRMAFQMLFWTGMRIGELLALTPRDIHWKQASVTVNKSYQRIHGKDVITGTKTAKSNRTLTLPAFLLEELRAYLGLQDGQNAAWDDPSLLPQMRIFPVRKSFLTEEMQRGIQHTGVKRIRLHDLRHSHASLLVDMNFSIKEIADRLGHEKVETTLNTYSHLYPNKQAQLAERLNLEYLGA